MLVSLADASRHPTVAAEYARRRSLEAANSDGARDEKKSRDVEGGGAGEGFSPYTVEGLRAEVNEDVATSGHDSAYDCKISCLVNR